MPNLSEHELLQMKASYVDFDTHHTLDGQTFITMKPMSIKQQGEVLIRQAYENTKLMKALGVPIADQRIEVSYNGYECIREFLYVDYMDKGMFKEAKEIKNYAKAIFLFGVMVYRTEV